MCFSFKNKEITSDKAAIIKPFSLPLCKKS